jgi:ribonucleoside-diphosphate reductase alpha chain
MAHAEPTLDDVKEHHKEPFYWLNEDSRAFLDEGYLLEGVTAEERVREIGERAEAILDDEGFADKFYDYMSRGFYSLASPVWSNFGLDRGLPISCFGSYMEDNMESILATQAEVGEMTKLGGGTSGYFGEIRPRGSPITNNGKSNGSYSFTELFDTIINVVSQGEHQDRGRPRPRHLLRRHHRRRLVPGDGRRRRGETGDVGGDHRDADQHRCPVHHLPGQHERGEAAGVQRQKL